MNRYFVRFDDSRIWDIETGEIIPLSELAFLIIEYSIHIFPDYDSYREYSEHNRG